MPAEAPRYNGINFVSGRITPKRTGFIHVCCMPSAVYVLQQLTFRNTLGTSLQNAPPPHFDGRCRSESDVPGQILHVGIGRRHVSVLQRQEIPLSFPAQLLFQDLDEVAKLHRMMAADVVDCCHSLAFRCSSWDRAEESSP